MSGTQSLDIDFSDANILITVNDLDTGLPSNLRFQDAYSTIPRFTRVTVNPATTFPGFTPSSRIYFEPNLISLILERVEGYQSKQISLDLTGVIPQPATVGLLLVGVALIAVRRGRIRNRNELS